MFDETQTLSTIFDERKRRVWSTTFGVSHELFTFKNMVDEGVRLMQMHELVVVICLSACALVGTIWSYKTAQNKLLETFPEPSLKILGTGVQNWLFYSVCATC